MRATTLPATLALLLALAGCSELRSVQEARSCPGDDCPAGLSALGDEVAALPGVTDVERTAWASGLDNGVSGRVELVAAGASRAEAAALAALVVERYLAADVEEPEVIDVEITTDPDQQFGAGGSYSFWADGGNWSRIRER